MEYVTLRKYKQTIRRGVITGILMTLICICAIIITVYNPLAMKEKMIAFVTVFLFIELLVLFSIICLIYKYKYLSKVCDYFPHQDGYVESYSPYKRYAYLLVNVKGEFFVTGRMFTCREAKKLVGKKVTCASIRNELFIYNIKG